MLCNPEFAFSGTEVAGGSTCIRLLQAAAKPLVCSALAFKYIISLCPRPNFFPHTYLVGVTVIKKTVDLSGQPALHSAALGWYESPSGASLAQFLLDCLGHIIFSLTLLPWARG